MRNKNRIKRIIQLLEEYWEMNPNLRLCQLVSNLHGNGKQDIFFTEDDEIEEVLQARIIKQSYDSTPTKL